MIRKAKKEDLASIIAIDNEVFLEKWSLKNYEYELSENPVSNFMVYTLNQKVVGYSIFWNLFDTIEIVKIAVDPLYQRQKIASQLMNNIIQQAVDVILLDVRVSNKKAINLYEKFGFKTINIRSQYYSDNLEDAYVMQRSLYE